MSNHRKLTRAILYFNEYLEKVPEHYPTKSNDDIQKELNAVIKTLEDEMEGVKVLSADAKSFFEKTYEFYQIKRKYFQLVEEKSSLETLTRVEKRAKEIVEAPNFPTMPESSYKSSSLADIHQKIDALKIYGRRSEDVKETTLERGWQGADPGFDDVYVTRSELIDFPSNASAKEIKSSIRDFLNEQLPENSSLYRFKMVKKKEGEVIYSSFMKTDIKGNLLDSSNYSKAYEREASDVFFLIDELRYQGHKNIEVFSLEYQINHPHPYIEMSREFNSGFIVIDRDTSEVILHTRQFKLDVDVDGEILDTRP